MIQLQDYLRHAELSFRSASLKQPHWAWALFGALVSGGLVAILRVGAATSPVDLSPPSFPAAPMMAPAPAPAAVASTMTAGAAASKASIMFFPVTHAPPTGPGKTLERQAIDAFHAGDRRQVVALYGELAARNPENPAIRAAARILGAEAP